MEEIQLILAEAALLKDAPDMAAALAALNAVRTSNASVFDATYDAYDMADFEAGGMVNNGGSAAESMRLEVLKEKYVSVIGLPTYQDVLRTKNLIGVPIKGAGTDVIPQRFIYPLSESAANDNFPGFIDQYVPTPIYN